MVPSLVESMGKNVSERWLESLLGPALLFWLGGLFLWITPSRLPQTWNEFTAMSLVTQSFLLVTALLLVSASDRFVAVLSVDILRFLEGHWAGPLRPLALRLAQRWQKAVRRARNRWSTLMLKVEDGIALTWRERRELARLEMERQYTPRDLEDLAPTRLGNVLRTAERRPWQRYGLDPVLLWPRLWLLLPETTRRDLAYLRLSLDRYAQAWFWGLLFALWSFVWPWAWLIALVWMGIAYHLLLQAAASFCDLVLAVFDTQRWRLYEALRWELPEESGESEIRSGQALSRYLQRGMSESPIHWQHGLG